MLLRVRASRTERREEGRRETVRQRRDGWFLKEARRQDAGRRARRRPSWRRGSRHVSVHVGPPALYLGAKILGAETCILGASRHGAELGVHFLKSFYQGRICENLSQKGLKNKKVGSFVAHTVLITVDSIFINC